MLIVADEPQSLVHLASAVDEPLPVVRAAVARLVADFDGVGVGDGVASTGTVRRGFELREVAGGWRIYVRATHDALVTDFVLTQNPSRLSQAALETLAVIAYKQPISRGAVASIRAVNVDGVVRTLLGRGLITEAFTDSETGAINYATTDLLLTQLGINSLDELPHLSPLLSDGAEGFEDLR
ncbi:SMC-Scp complex subunit ScpB [Leifsonia kafniensis]|uniref:SMC-Scp complex subunit ScpB n=1 Tax=Leifsonia kafniensis TaxID=475957 RepID=UPI003CD0635C